MALWCDLAVTVGVDHDDVAAPVDCNVPEKVEPSYGSFSVSMT